MIQNKLELVKKNNEQLVKYFDRYDDKFSIKKKPLYRNKKRLTLNLKKTRIKNSLLIWNNLPFSLLIYAMNLKIVHNMFNYFYTLKDCIIIKKHRNIYQQNFANKNTTGFNCYRIYCSNFLKLYDNIEEIINYEVNVLGFEIHGILYSIEEISKYLQTIKEDLNIFFNYINNFNNDFNNIFNYFSQIDQDFNQNLQEIFIICQHITKSDVRKE